MKRSRLRIRPSVVSGSGWLGASLGTQPPGCSDPAPAGSARRTVALVESREARAIALRSVGLCPPGLGPRGPDSRSWKQGPGGGGACRASHTAPPRGQRGGGRAPRGGRSRAWRPFIRRNELFAVPGVGEDEPVIIFKFAIIDLGKSYCDKNELIIKFISEINSAAIRQLAAGAGAAGARAFPPPSPRRRRACSARCGGSGRTAASRAPLPRAPGEPAAPDRPGLLPLGGGTPPRRPRHRPRLPCAELGARTEPAGQGHDAE